MKRINLKRKNLVCKVLKNGLTVIIAPSQETSIVATWLFAHGGSDYETPEDNGIQHFLEHMYFKGTDIRTAHEIWKAIEGRGGEMNGQTSRQTVGFGTEANYWNLDSNLELFADMLLSSKFEPAGIEKEKNIIIREKREDEDDYLATLFELWDKHLYPGSSWGLPIIGPEENINDMTQEKLIACKEKYYRANSMVLGIAGRVESKKTLELVKKYFSRIKNGERQPNGDGFKPEDQKQISLHFKEIESTYLMLGIKNEYNLYHSLKCASEVLGVILGGNASSRLFTLVRGEKGLAYAIRTCNTVYTNRADLATFTSVNHGDLEQAIKLIMQEYRKVATQGVTEEELELVKEYKLGEMGRLFEGSSMVAGSLVLKKLFSEPQPTPWHEMEALKSVTLEEVNRVARDIFSGDRVNLVVVGPHRGREAELEKLLAF